MAHKLPILPPLLGGHKAPYWGLAFAGLLIAQLSCQVYSSLKDIQKESKGSHGSEPEVGLLSPLWPLLPGLIPAALDHGSLRKETGLMKWKLSGRTYKHPTDPSYCPSHYQDPSVQKIHSLAATKAF